jgi:hypothetical protein
MKRCSLVLALLLIPCSMCQAIAQSRADGTITFSGQIVDVKQGQSLTQVVAQPAAISDVNPTPTYAVYSSVTGRRLAYFGTAQAAQHFASIVSVESVLSK